ncbi:hypothetical protein ACTQ4E_15635 [Lawsonibacter sp. LCP25S3_G6]|uniref:hypothetical protein n=1 Tax=unclassified Lawsonibacter TaxID=2617946 RepID=UPI003F9E9C9E
MMVALCLKKKESWCCDLNSKMTAAANEIGNSIFKYYEEEYLDTLFSNELVVEDVIFQILVECCRYAYLINAEKHSLKYYIERDGLELELARKNNKRIIDYVNDHYELEGKRLKETIGVDILKPDTKPQKQTNRFPGYELSEFQYWEIQNIHDMGLVKAIIERRIGSSKKISVDRFIDMANQYDEVIGKQRGKFNREQEATIFSSLVLFTLETKYSFEFFYALATEMEAAGVTQIPDMENRLMATAGSYKCTSCLPDICPAYAHDNDRFVEYPMILQRQRFLKQIVSLPAGSIGELSFSRIIEANVLANAVQSHIYLNGKPMRVWFAENTDINDWASVFETYDVFRTYHENKSWSPAKIQAVRKMYDALSLDYKSLSRKPSIEN